MISTKPSHLATLVDTEKINQVNERIMKPSVVLDYNKGKQGIDSSDQLSTYYTCFRRSKKWYLKVAFEMIFKMSIVNAYLTYKEYYSTRMMTMLRVRENLVRSLLLGVPFENVQQAKRSANSRVISSKKNKDLIAMSEDVVLAVTRKTGNNNQEKHAMQQQRE